MMILQKYDIEIKSNMIMQGKVLCKLVGEAKGTKMIRVSDEMERERNNYVGILQLN